MKNTISEFQNHSTLWLYGLVIGCLLTVPFLIWTELQMAAALVAK